MIHLTHRSALLSAAIFLLLPPTWLIAQSDSEAPPPGPVVELPALEVSGAIANARPWRYLAAPGIEVLSRCKDSTTVQFVQALHRLDQLTTLLLPTEFQVTLSVPKIFILSDQASTPTSAQDVVTGRNPGAGADSKNTSGSPAHSPASVRFHPNLRLEDMDAIVIYAIVDEGRFDPDALTIASEHLQFLLNRRSPPLPAWFKRAIMRLHATTRADREGLRIAPASWRSMNEATRILGDLDYPRTLLAMDDLFADETRPAATPEEQALRTAQAALLVRWALEEKGPATREALWQFVRRTAVEPPSETIFEECFGFGYAEMRDRLSDYLPLALSRPLHLPTGDLAKLPDLAVRPATHDDVGHLKGEWERLEIAYVKARHAEFVPKYTQQAQRTYTGAYVKGARDPRFLASFGLYSADVGDTAKARELLEAACAAKVVRPRAYLELARLRATEALAQPAGANGLLSGRQTNTILQPLAIGRQHAPPLAATYILAGQVWAQSNARLTPAQFALLDEGIRFFPTDPNILFNTAVLKSTHGAHAEAIALIERGERSNPTPAARERFQKIRDTLLRPAQSPPAENPPAPSAPASPR